MLNYMKTYIIGVALTAMLGAGAQDATAAQPSGTLPIVYIETEGHAPIVSKDDYINATCRIDPLDSGYDAYGTEAEPLAIEIRGRGNYTWTGFDKKPYKLKLGKKAGLLGMDKNKHYALLAHADDNCGYMRNVLGFETSRRMGLSWTPTDRAVEVVLNGDYLGLYFLTETVRVDSSRVDITEQPDLATDPADVSGGWLVEIDNYPNDPHVEIYENGDRRLLTYFTYKTPEILSSEQETWLTEQMQAIDDVLYKTDENSREWENWLDPDAAARYYIVQEVLDDCESFHGSCYLYHDAGDDTRWKFGPVWDFGNSYQRDQKSWIYRGGMFWQTWIGQLATKTSFQERVREVWREFAEEAWPGLEDYMDATADHIRAAAACDAQRWPQYSGGNFARGVETARSRMRGSVSWLGTKLGKEVVLPVHGETVYVRGDFNGWDTSTPMTEISTGVYVAYNLYIDGSFKVATSDWSTVDFGGDGSKIHLDVPYTLVKQGRNISSDDNLVGINMELDLNRGTLLLTRKTVGVVDTVNSESEVTEVYDMLGRCVLNYDGVKGLRILRRADGTTIKVLGR